MTTTTCNCWKLFLPEKFYLDVNYLQYLFHLSNEIISSKMIQTLTLTDASLLLKNYGPKMLNVMPKPQF